MTTRFVFSLCASALLLLSCQKDELNNEQQKEEGPIITASYEAADTKTELDTDGKTPKWSEGDQVWVSDGTAENKKTITLAAAGSTLTTENGVISSDGRGFQFISPSTESSATIYAVYPAPCAVGTVSSNKVRITIPSFQDGTFKNANICVAIGSGTSIKFKNVVAVLKVKQSENANRSISFNATAVVAGTFYADANGDLSNPSSNKSKTVSGLISGTEGYYALAPGITEDQAPALSVIKMDAHQMASKRLPNAAKTITRNKLYSVTAPSSRYVGMFSVSDYKKVSFATGNLQAVYSTSTSSYSWRFAANQWDYIGNAAGNTTIDSQTDGAVVDLFCFSTSATNYGINTSENTSTYSGDFRDWGNALPSSYGTWRTLTGGVDGEWDYLIFSRRVKVGDKSKYSYGQGKVNGVNGLIILPDNWDGSVCPEFTYSSTAWSNTFTESTTPKWSDMEAVGCVFLPTAGNRKGSTFEGVGEQGFYSSSTATDARSTSSVYNLIFKESYVRTKYTTGRYQAQSVRLVQDVLNETITNTNTETYDNSTEQPW